MDRCGATESSLESHPIILSFPVSRQRADALSFGSMESGES